MGVFLMNGVGSMLRAGLGWDAGSGVFVIGGLVLLIGSAAWIAMGAPKLAKASR
jgi:hypothetical protein